MRELSSNSHRIPTLRRIMGFMGIAVKVLIGLVLLLPMTAYVVGSLVAAAEEPQQHQPIIVEEQTQKPAEPGKSSSQAHTHKPDDHGKNKGHGGGRDDDPEVVQPSPSVLDDDGDVFDDHGGLENSGKGSGGGGDDNSGKGSGDD
jgi:hypothetical protein